MNMYKTLEKTKKTKDVGILFSGGLDSTYLLWKNLKEGNNVTPYYTEILNNLSKSRIEKQQMAKIVGVLRQEFGDKLKYPRYASKTELWLNMWNNSLKFKQTPIWLMSTLYMDQSHDEIQIGYVANDDSIPYLNQIKKTYTAMGWFLNENKHRPKLVFPIFQTPKFEMLDQLPHTLKALIYSCEAPLIMDEREPMNEDSLKFYRGSLMEFFEKDNEDRPVFLNHEPCGDCDPCRKILTYLYEHYVNEQPIYKKLKTMQTMQEFNNLMRDASYNKEVKEMYNELQKKHEFLTTFKDFSVEDGLEKAEYKEVALVNMDWKGSKERAESASMILSINKAPELIADDMICVEIDKVGS